MRRLGGSAAGILAAGMLLAGCMGGGDPGGTPQPTGPGDASSPPPDTAAPSPSADPSPDPEAIRGVDFGELTWTWDTAGERFEVAMSGGESSVHDPGVDAEVRISVGDPVFSDANGDGLLDAAVPGTWESIHGTGVAVEWFIWLAQADAPDEPQQVSDAIAFGARCGDVVDGVTPIDGGFRVEETMLSALEQGNACADNGTMHRVRDVGAVGDGSGAGSFPATLDGKGWGGFCPVREYTEGVLAEAEGQVAPSGDVPATSVAGERLYSPMQSYPLHVPDGWRLIGFIPEPDPEGDDSLVCVWRADGE